MLYKSGLDCKWNVNHKFNGFNGEGGGFRRIFNIYMRRCPKAGRLHPCPLLLKTFSKIKKLFSIVKSFSIFGNLFTILNSLIHRSISHPMIA